MDNNAAERTLRGPIVGRKNYYGSSSEWSAQLSSYLFSIFMTLKLWGINPRIWLGGYLEACALNVIFRLTRSICPITKGFRGSEQ